MENLLKLFQNIGNETVNLMNAKTKEQRKTHKEKLLKIMPNINPLLLLMLEK
jgi:hypothetical protein